MPPTDPRYQALHERYSDILPATDDDPALTRLVRDLDTLMQAPAPATLRRMNTSLPQANQASETAPRTQPDAAPAPIPYSSATRRQRRFGAVIATVAAALVVALLAGTLLTRMAGTPGQTSIANVHYAPPKGACPADIIRADLPAHSELSAIDIVSPNEGWALGADLDPTSGAPLAGLILRYTRCSWAPIYMFPPGAGLSSISMGSASDGWAVGVTNKGEPVAMRITNNSLKPVSPPPGADVLHGGVYSSVRMLSADEGWISFNRVKDSSGNLTQGLLHLVNGKWSEVATPFLAMSDMLPVAPNDAWVVGYPSVTQQTPAMYHYQAGTWTKMALPTGIAIYTLRMVTPNDIWASGQMDRGSNREAGAVLHYDGSQWRQVTAGASGRPQDVEAFDQGAAWAFTRYDPMVTTGNTPPLNDSTISGAQYQHDGVWSWVEWPFTRLTRIGAISRVSSDEYWAIGYYMVTTSRTPTGNGGYASAGHEVAVLLYFANGAWYEIGQTAGG